MWIVSLFRLSTPKHVFACFTWEKPVNWMNCFFFFFFASSLLDFKNWVLCFLIHFYLSLSLYAHLRMQRKKSSQTATNCHFESEEWKKKSCVTIYAKQIFTGQHIVCGLFVCSLVLLLSFAYQDERRCRTLNDDSDYKKSNHNKIVQEQYKRQITLNMLVLSYLSLALALALSLCAAADKMCVISGNETVSQ